MEIRDIPGVKRLVSEMLDVLYSAYLLKQGPVEGDDLLANMREVKVMWLLTDDVILRLAKFRDDDNRSWSFREAAKALKKNGDTMARAEAAEPLIKDFRQKSQNLGKFRDTTVAHLAKNGIGGMQPLTDLYDTVKLAVEILDVLAGTKNSYEVLDVDLRRETCGQVEG